MVWERLAITIQLLELPYEDIESIHERTLILSSNLFASIAPLEMTDYVEGRAEVFFNAAYSFLEHDEQGTEALENVEIAIQRFEHYIQLPTGSILSDHMIVPMHDDGSEGTMASHTPNPVSGAQVYTQADVAVNPVSTTPVGRIIPFNRFK